MIIARIKGIQTIIEKGLSKIRNPYVSCSFGKDSIVLLYFILKKKPDIPVVYLSREYEMPEIYEFKDYLKKKWKLNLIEVKDIVDHYEMCKEIGLEFERDEKHKNLGNKLKKGPLVQFAKDKGYDGFFWGIRADESRTRRNYILYRGNCHQGKDGFWRCSPLAYITAFELWRIIDILEIPYCRLYDKTKFFSREQLRNGGWLGTTGIEKGRIVHLKYYYPDLFRKIEKDFPHVRSFV